MEGEGQDLPSFLKIKTKRFADLPCPDNSFGEIARALKAEGGDALRNRAPRVGS